jgi:hypothetical protein
MVSNQMGHLIKLHKINDTPNQDYQWNYNKMGYFTPIIRLGYLNVLTYLLIIILSYNLPSYNLPRFTY